MNTSYLTHAGNNVASVTHARCIMIRMINVVCVMKMIYVLYIYIYICIYIHIYIYNIFIAACVMKMICVACVMNWMIYDIFH